MVAARGVGSIAGTEGDGRISEEGPDEIVDEQTDTDIVWDFLLYTQGHSLTREQTFLL